MTLVEVPMLGCKVKLKERKGKLNDTSQLKKDVMKLTSPVMSNYKRHKKRKTQSLSKRRRNFANFRKKSEWRE